MVDGNVYTRYILVCTRYMNHIFVSSEGSAVVTTEAKPKGGKSTLPEKDKWMRPKQVAELLTCDVSTLKRSYGGVFTEIRPKGFGPGKPLRYHSDEVMIFKATGDRLAVLAHRKKHKRIK